MVAARVAVIAAAEGDELAARANTPVEPELQRHLHGDFHCDRPGLGEEHAGEIARQQAGKPARERKGFLVHQPAEHHVRHGGELALDGCANMRMIVAVAGGPPRRNAVDQHAPVGEKIRLPSVRTTASGGMAVFVCV